jgi:hypothetical protein
MKQPRHMAHKGHAERHSGKILRGKDIARPEVAVRGVHLDHALLNSVKPFKGGNQLSGGEMLDVQPPARHDADFLDHVSGAAGTDSVEGGGRAITVGHAPVECVLCAGNGRGCDACTYGRQGRGGKKLATVQGVFLSYDLLVTPQHSGICNVIGLRRSPVRPQAAIFFPCNKIVYNMA